MVENLKIYKVSYRLTGLIYRAMPEMPRKDKFLIGVKMNECSLSMLDYITLAYLTTIKMERHSKGVEFVGSVIKPHRIYLHNRSVHNAFEKIKELNKLIPDMCNVEKFRDTVNSYLGMMGRYASHNIRKRLVMSIDPRWWRFFSIAPGARKVVLRKKYTRREIDKNKLLKIKHHVSGRNQQKEL